MSSLVLNLDFVILLTASSIAFSCSALTAVSDIRYKERVIVLSEAASLISSCASSALLAPQPVRTAGRIINKHKRRHKIFLLIFSSSKLVFANEIIL